ncbi:MAG: hypothetical protein KGZ94_11020 [Clostridia bacterium]|nr:hypothetical protein [Clostridia bacterium]
MMRNLRKVKKMKGLMIVLIIILSIGLVGSVTLMGLGGQQPPTSVDPSLPREEQISFFEGLLVEYSAKLEKDSKDQETLGALAEIHWHLANLHEDAEKQKQEMNNSLGYYLKLLELNPEDINLMTQVAVVAYTAGNDDLAQENFEKALQLDQGNVNTLANYGVYLMNSKGDFKGALTQFEKALEQDISDDAREQLEVFAGFAKQMIEALEADSENEGTEGSQEKTSTN